MRVLCDLAIIKQMLAIVIVSVITKANDHKLIFKNSLRLTIPLC